MKIIYLHQYFITPTMIGITRSYEMARRLVSDGHEVHIITTDQQGGVAVRPWRETLESGIKVHWANVRYSNHMSFPRRMIAFASFAIKATKKAMGMEGDIIFATSTPLTIAIPALVASAWKRIPFVFEVRDMWPDVPIAIGAIRNPLLVWCVRQLELLTYRRAAHIIALAPGMRQDIIAKGIPEDKVTVIPNGCDLDVFSVPPRGISPRAEFEWLGARKLVLFAGTIGMINGVDYLVHLACRIRELDPEIRFVIIGGGKEREAVIALAAHKGVLNHSLFVLEPMPKLDLVRWLHAADMHVALFTGPRVVWKDAVQNKFFDALATGKPIANNFDGWQSQIALEAGVGLILDPQDMSLAGRQLVDSLHDEAWLSSVPTKAKVLAEGRFNRQHLARQLEKTLAAAVAKRP